MKNGILLTILAMFLFGTAATAPALAQVRPYRVTDTQVRNLLRQIETKTDVYQRQMNNALDRGRLNGTDREETILGYITEFENATDTLRRAVESRGTIYTEVNDVLMRATYLDQVMRRNTLTPAAQQQWGRLRADMNTLARYYNVNWNWNQTLPTFPGGGVSNVDRARVRTLLTRIETNTDVFRDAVSRTLDRSRINNTNREDDIMAFINGFENATDELRRDIDSNRSDGDLNLALSQAAYIDQFMARNRLTNAAETRWISIRNDLNVLASLYRVSWNWNQKLPPYPGTGTTFPGGGIDSRVTGTYRLNTSLSENVSTVVSRAVNQYYTGTQRENVRQRLERRLASPNMIAIEKNGRSVTMASTNSPQVQFDADGVTRTETNNRGRVTRVTASTDNDGFSIDYVGDRTNDFYVDFSSTGNNQLRVTRRLYLENRNETITVSSVYDKVDSYARWNDVNTGGTWNGNTGTNLPTEFYIPNGTRLTAQLRNNVNTRDSQVGDRFTLEVTSPNQYRGAIIEGRITGEESSGRVTGRSSMSFEFDTIRMTNGQTYRFAGLIDSVRTANGDNVSVNNEGAVREGSQTTRTVTRAGIGAAIGAIIGAIAGGGQGAAIGAAVGAGAGAGTVLIQGRDNIELGQGTEFQITASAPNNVGFNR